MSSAISRALAIIVVVVIIVAAAVAVYLLYPTITGTTTQTGTVAIALEIGAADASDVPQIYAMTHYLPQFGYTANLNIFTGQSAADAALISGSAQVLLGVANEGPALSSKGVDILTFGTAYSETDEILVCTGNITSMGQLAQQHVTVGMTSLTDISYVVPDVYLATHGYNASSVNWIIVPGAAGRGAALLSGKIPCGATDVTSTLELLAQPNNKFHILATLASLEPQFPFIMWMTTKSFFSSHQSLLTALLKANILAYRWAQNKTNYLSYGPSVVGASINTTTLASSYDLLKTIGIWNPNIPWNITIANNVANITGTYNLGVNTIVNPSQWTDFTLYQQAINAEGTVTYTPG